MCGGLPPKSVRSTQLVFLHVAQAGHQRATADGKQTGDVTPSCAAGRRRDRARPARSICRRSFAVRRLLGNHQFFVVALFTLRVVTQTVSLRLCAFSTSQTTACVTTNLLHDCDFAWSCCSRRFPLACHLCPTSSSRTVCLPLIQPDSQIGSHLSMNFGFVIVDDISHPILATVAFQLCIRQPEIDHDWICIGIFVFTLGTAVGQQRLRRIDVAGCAGSDNPCLREASVAGGSQLLALAIVCPLLWSWAWSRRRHPSP